MHLYHILDDMKQMKMVQKKNNNNHDKSTYKQINGWIVQSGFEIMKDINSISAFTWNAQITRVLSVY